MARDLYKLLITFFLDLDLQSCPVFICRFTKLPLFAVLLSCQIERFVLLMSIANWFWYETTNCSLGVFLSLDKQTYSIMGVILADTFSPSMIHTSYSVLHLTD